MARIALTAFCSFPVASLHSTKVFIGSSPAVPVVATVAGLERERGLVPRGHDLGRGLAAELARHAFGHRRRRGLGGDRPDRTQRALVEAFGAALPQRPAPELAAGGQ